MAGKKEINKPDKKYLVSVSNTNYCGEGAGGAQFAHGCAVITSERLANWFLEHEGYTVKEMSADNADAAD